MKDFLKNKKILIASLLVTVLLIGGAVTVALVTARANDVTNKFEVADNDTKIVEEFGDSDLDKNVYVFNESETTAAFVRVRLTVSSDQKEGIELILDSNWSKNWEKDGDFYYYKRPLQPQEKTEKLLDEIGLENFKGTTFDVTAYEESCVAAGYEKGKDVSLATIKETFTKATEITSSNGGNQ